MGTVVIEGVVFGSIEAQRLILRGRASVTGNVQCSSVEMGPQSTMIGQMKSIHEEKSESSIPLKQEVYVSKRNILVLLEPQVDFHSGGSCAVPGADENSQNIASFLIRHKENFEEIIVGLDNHHVYIYLYHYYSFSSTCSHVIPYICRFPSSCSANAYFAWCILDQ